MSHDKYLLVGHAVAFADVGEVLAQGRKVIMLDFDENTWEEIGVRLILSHTLLPSEITKRFFSVITISILIGVTSL